MVPRRFRGTRLVLEGLATVALHHKRRELVERDVGVCGGERHRRQRRRATHDHPQRLHPPARTCPHWSRRDGDIWCDRLLERSERHFGSGLQRLGSRALRGRRKPRRVRRRREQLSARDRNRRSEVALGLQRDQCGPRPRHIQDDGAGRVQCTRGVHPHRPQRQWSHDRCQFCCRLRG